MIIKKLELLTRDLAATTTFYGHLLGYEIADKGPDCVSFQVGFSILTFRVTTASRPFYHVAFSVPSNKIDESYAWLGSRVNILPFNGSWQIVDFVNWNARAFYFHDDQQNILEFISHLDLNITSPEPFGASSITGICEIGVPVNDVAKACETINREHDIPWFYKGPRLADFAVMGDDNGLLIVTKAGRGWLPTMQPAEQHDTGVFIENNEISRELFFGHVVT